MLMSRARDSRLIALWFPVIEKQHHVIYFQILQLSLRFDTVLTQRRFHVAPGRKKLAFGLMRFTEHENSTHWQQHKNTIFYEAYFPIKLKKKKDLSSF